LHEVNQNWISLFGHLFLFLGDFAPFVEFLPRIADLQLRFPTELLKLCHDIVECDPDQSAEGIAFHRAFIEFAAQIAAGQIPVLSYYAWDLLLSVSYSELGLIDILPV
jgi:hypothetical protein